jgi:hypothetical protein
LENNHYIPVSILVSLVCKLYVLLVAQLLSLSVIIQLHFIYLF